MLFLHVLLSVCKHFLLVALLDAVKDLLDCGVVLANNFLVQKRLVKLGLQLCKLLPLHRLHPGRQYFLCRFAGRGLLHLEL